MCGLSPERSEYLSHVHRTIFFDTEGVKAILKIYRMWKIALYTHCIQKDIMKLYFKQFYMNDINLQNILHTSEIFINAFFQLFKCFYFL